MFLVVDIVCPQLSHAAQLTFSPRTSVRSEYTDNLFLSTPGNEESDVITRVSAGATAGIAGPTAFFNISYDPYYAFYKKFDENNGWGHVGDINAQWDMTKFTTFDFTNNFISFGSLSNAVSSNPGARRTIWVSRFT